MRVVLTCLLMLAATPAMAEAEHPCAEHARERGVQLLRFHIEAPELEVGVDETVVAIAPIRSIRGEGAFDVLEVWGYVYRSEYRMRFIYAQIRGMCVLMGEEILAHADPYYGDIPHLPGAAHRLLSHSAQPGQ